MRATLITCALLLSAGIYSASSFAFGPGPGGGRPGGGPGFGGGRPIGPVGPVGPVGPGPGFGGRYFVQPQWWAPEYQRPWAYMPGMPVGYWQCTAYNQQYQAFSAYGVDMYQAAAAANGTCEQQSYDESCYIPQGYCNLYP